MFAWRAAGVNPPPPARSSPLQGVFFRSVCFPGRMRAPGPGRPVTLSIVSTPVAASQKVVTRMPPVLVFGYMGSGQTGAGGSVFPVRTMAPPPAVGKQGVLVELLQHSWLMPPFESTQFPLASCETQASPVQVAAHGEPLQLSSLVSPHGFGPASVDVPEGSGSRMSSVAAFAAGAGGQEAERPELRLRWDCVTITSD